MAKPPPRTTANSTIAELAAPYAVPMPIIAAMNATNTSPSRNMVAVIRTVSPRSGAYLVRAAMATPPFGPGWLCRPEPSAIYLAQIYPYNAERQPNVTHEYAPVLRNSAWELKLSLRAQLSGQAREL